MSNSILTLSKDLKELICEFLALSDLHNLQLVSQDFHELLKHNSILWSKQLFFLFLDYVPEEDLLWELPLYLERLTINEDTINFATMDNSRDLIETHYTLKKQYQAFLNRFLLPHQTDNLIGEIFNSFKRPVYPAPCLKREIHFFSTSTTFQNFLTEIHFGLHSHVSSTDRNQSLIETIIHKIKTYSSQAPIKSDRLILLRWYSASKSESKALNKSTSTEQRNSTPKSEVHRANQSSVLLEDFNGLVSGLPIRHCQEVAEYLKAVRKDSDLLYEYLRFWNGYVMATMSLNGLFLPFSKHVNAVYNENCHYLPNFPEFSVWRMMIKAWLDHVFSPLSQRLCEAFRRIITGIRKAIGFNEISKGLEANGTEEDVNENSCRLSQNIEAETDLLVVLYKAMADLSCDEFTVFFEGCTSTILDTPKGMLNKVVLEDTQKIYRLCGELLLSRPEQVFNFFKRDTKLAGDIFGSELAYKIENEQGAAIKETLTVYFNQNVKQMDLSPEDLIGSSVQSRLRRSFDLKDLDLMDMVSGLGIEVDKKVLSGLLVKIGMESVLLSLLFRTMNVITEELKKRSKEQDEVLQEVIERGFERIEEGHQCMFALNRDSLELCLSRGKEEEIQKL